MTMHRTNDVDLYIFITDYDKLDNEQRPLSSVVNLNATPIKWLTFIYNDKYITHVYKDSVVSDYFLQHIEYLRY